MITVVKCYNKSLHSYLKEAKFLREELLGMSGSLNVVSRMFKKFFGNVPEDLENVQGYSEDVRGNLKDV